jgi:hypothetical protein
MVQKMRSSILRDELRTWLCGKSRLQQPEKRALNFMVLASSGYTCTQMQLCVCVCVTLNGMGGRGQETMIATRQSR